jgi:hypothetical protein
LKSDGEFPGDHNNEGRVWTMADEEHSVLADQELTVEVLLVQAALQSLLNRFCIYDDLGDAASAAELFTPDCVVDYGPFMGGEVVGRDAVKATISAGLAMLRASSHHLSNAVFAVGNDGTAKSVSYVCAWHQWVESKPDSVVMGQYHDEFRLHEGQWRISKRVFKVAGQVNQDSEWYPIGRRTDFA